MTLVNGRWSVNLPPHRADWDGWSAWEVARFDSMARNIRPGDVVFDVGAEQGDISAVYAQFCGGSTMVLFEPNPRNWRTIKSTWEANSLPAPLGTCVALVGDVDLLGIPDFDAADRDDWPECAHAPGIQQAAQYRYIHNAEDSAVTPQVTLDAWVEEHRVWPNVLTIDVEGAELRVLAGACRMLRERRPLVYVSVHPDLMERDYGQTKAALLEHMRNFGFVAQLLGIDHEEHWAFWHPDARVLDVGLDPLTDRPLRLLTGCDAGHGRHATLDLTVNLRGRSVVREYPAVPPRLAQTFPMRVYDDRAYADTRGYCTGDDDFSKSLRVNGTWEGFETLLMMQILSVAGPSPLVLDFGSQLGWYSVIAARMGARVVAFEMDAENADNCRKNLDANGAQDATVLHTCIGSATPASEIERFGEGGVAFLKADVEGAEDEVVRVCEGLFRRGLIAYALLEISPVLAAHYPDTVERVASYGYDVFDIPSKACPNRAEFEVDPLAALRRYRIEPTDLRAHTAALRQSNFLFAKRPL